MASIAESDPRIEAVARANFNHNYYGQRWDDDPSADEYRASRQKADRQLYRADAVRMLAAADAVDTVRQQLTAQTHRADRAEAGFRRCMEPDAVTHVMWPAHD